MIHRYSRPESIEEAELAAVAAPVKSSALTPAGFRYTVLGPGVAHGSLPDVTTTAQATGARRKRG